MSSRDLFRAIGQIDDDLIESANKTPVKHTIPLQFRHFVPAAACFCLVLLGAAMVSQDRSAGVSQAAETADLNESAPCLCLTICFSIFNSCDNRRFCIGWLCRIYSHIY